MVYVDNRPNRDIPTISADFTIFGGMYRECELIETDEVCVDPTYYGGSGVMLKIDPKRGHVTAEARVLGGANVTREYDFPGFELWSPENPKLYSITITLANGDAVTVPFGFRTAEFDEDGNFCLNGKVRRLNGVNRHQDREGKGWAISRADEREDVALMREMGVNAVRTAHYPESGYFYDLLDEAGMMAWVETPVTEVISPTPAYQATLDQMIREMVVQLGNHPSICMWSIFNELQNSWAPNLPEKTCVDYLEMQKRVFNEMDGTRPIVAAAAFLNRHGINAVPDALAINTYTGWYWGTLEMIAGQVADALRENKRLKIGVSEYGSGANPIQHEWPTVSHANGDFHPEEFQAVQHATQYRSGSRVCECWTG